MRPSINEADATTSNTLGCFYYLGFNHNFAAATPATKPTAAGVHHDDGQAGRNGEDENPEHRGDDAQPETGTRPRRCRYDRVRAHAGYKCTWYGTEFRRMDRGYPSSRTCRGCGTVKQSRLLSERTCQCTTFGFRVRPGRERRP